MSTVRRIERFVKRSGKVLSTTRTETVASAAKKMTDHQIGCLVVLDEQGGAAGILSERDVLGKVVAKSKNPAGTLVGEVMTRNVISVSLDTAISRARRVMTEYGIRHLPIVEDGIPVGMISSRDVMAHELSASKAVIRRTSRILQDLECEHPGITRLEVDTAGRIII